jgi:hypothetical protein
LSSHGRHDRPAALSVWRGAGRRNKALALILMPLAAYLVLLDMLEGLVQGESLLILTNFISATGH